MSSSTHAPPTTDDERIQRFGYRPVSRTLPDGTVIEDRIPLTLEDLLHPEFGDVAMHSRQHALEISYLASVFESRLATLPRALVLSDTKIDWEGDTASMRHHAPDVAVLLNVFEERDDWTSFVVAEQGTRPALIIEVVSPAYRENDTVTKVEHYLHCRVPCYVIVDRAQVGDPPSLIGRIRRGNEWRPLLPNDNGWLWLEPVGVYLGIENDRVRCFDPKTLQPLGDYTEVSKALALKEDQLAAERQLRLKAEAKAEQAEAKAEQAEAKAEQAEAKAEQAEVARREAEAARQREAEARTAAEIRIAELEARLRNNPTQ